MGNQQSLPLERENHLQGCLFRGYVSSQEGKSMKERQTGTPAALRFYPFFFCFGENFAGCNGMNLTISVYTYTYKMNMYMII